MAAKNLATLLRPAKVSLANIPTPMRQLSFLNREIEPTLFAKRDDETGCVLSGNKIRKLEFLFADAKAKGATRVLTTGGWASNHARATAIAARQLGMDCTLVLRAAEDTVVDGNLFLSKLVGSEVTMCTAEEYADAPGWPILLEREAKKCVERDRKCVPYIIPEGGSNALGCWGYIGALEEMVDSRGTIPYTHIVTAVGSGGTLAGLLIGKHMLGAAAKHLKIIGVPVVDDEAYWRERVGSIVDSFNKRFGTNIKTGEYELLDNYTGPGYGITYPKQLETMRRAAKVQGLFLDPVYTGKAFHGLWTEIKGGQRFAPSDRIVFLHTGGIFGLLAQKQGMVDPLV